MSFIIAENITKQYGKGDLTVTAVHEMNFTIESGEFIAVMGESGAGKSTLLSIMGAMNHPSTGKYTVDTIDVYALGLEQQADFRREYLGFVFQSFHLIPYLTVLENVMLPLTNIHIQRNVKREKALEALQLMDMNKKESRLTHQLSGGEKERVSIARSIVNAPPILLADEPTGNLDSKNSDTVMQLLKQLNQNGMTVIMVTHSNSSAKCAERIMTINDGQLIPQ